MEIIDNVNKTLKEDLTTEIHKGSKVSIAAACFSIYAFAELKKELKNVVGNYFTIKLLAECSQDDLFTQERKIKVMLFAGSTLVNGNMIYSIKPGEAIDMEYELTNGIDKVVIADKNTAAQIDSCEIKKSSSRDIDDLF